jgi:hypothetical protein
MTQKPFNVSSASPEGLYNGIMIKAKWARLLIAEQRLILFLLTMISTDDTDFQIYRIRVKDLAKILDQTTTDVYLTFDKVTNELMTKLIKWTYIERDNLRRHKSTWLSYASLHENEGFVEFSIDSKLKPFLLAIKGDFTQYELGAVISLKCFYSFKIYKLLKYFDRLASPGGPRAIIVKLDWLRDYLGLEKSEYPLYGNLKARIIVPAQNDLADQTDLVFTFAQITTGRIVDEISFQWAYNEAYKEKATFLELIPLDGFDTDKGNSIDETSLALQLRIIGVSNQVIPKVLRDHSTDILAAAIADFKIIIQTQGGSIHNHGAYFCSLLPEPGRPYNTSALTRSIRKQQEIKQNKKRIAQLVDLLSLLELRYQEHRAKLALATLKAKPISEQETHRSRFIETVVNRNVILKSRLNSEGFETILVQAEFEAYLVDKLLPASKAVDYTEFCRSQGQDVVSLQKELMGLKKALAQTDR